MKAAFAQILNMSLTGSAVILLVLAARLLLKRAPKIFSYALWGVVLFRLLCPVSLSASVSMLGWLKPQVQSATQVTSTVSYLPDTYIQNRAAAAALPQAAPAQTREAPTDKTDAPDLLGIASYIWLAGAAIMALYSAVQYLRLRKRLGGAAVSRDGSCVAEGIDTPFVMGVLRPRIYLPSDLSGQEREFILAHERRHIRRGDPLWKLLGYLALCLHWFNPLVWAAFVLSSKDMEMSCDEAVIKELGPRIRADYSAALLRLSACRRPMVGMPLAFGEGDTKGRIVNMARWKKPKTWVRVACGAVCLGLLLACGLNPRQAAGTEEAVRVSGPANVRVGELSFRLPGGLHYESSPDSPEIGALSDGTNVVGGVMTFPLPKEISGWEWLHSLDLWEWGDDTLGYFADGTPGAAVSLEFFSDVPQGVERRVLRKHQFLFGSDRLYDLWLDELLLEPSLQEALLSSGKIGGEPEAISTPLPFEIGTLPEGISTLSGENGDILFTNGTSIVGGITGYQIPEGVYDANDGIFLWLEDVGIPDYEDSSLAFWGGISDFGDGWIATFASDVPEGEEITVKRTHHFRPAGNMVYDFWVDELLLDKTAQFALQDGVRFIPPVSREELEHTAEDEAFSRCFSVMNGLQDGSVHLRTVCEYDNTPEKNYTEDFYLDGEFGWMRVTTAADGETRGELYAQDRCFTGIGNGEIVWTETEALPQGSGPWLGEFYFVKHNVTYIDTLEKENGLCDMFRVDAPFTDEEGAAQYYFLEFYFDSQGNFVKVQLHVNSYREDAFTRTEAIVTLDADTVMETLQREYQRAMGERPR